MFSSPTVLSNIEYYYFIANQLIKQYPFEITTILEPCVRNTAPAIAAAAFYMASSGQGDDVMLVMPSDHQITKSENFIDAIKNAAKLAENGYIVTFGIKPSSAETGYGYVQLGEALDSGAYKVSEFTEKPNELLASKYVESGDYYWNSGIFAFTPNMILQEMKKYCPDILNLAQQSLGKYVEGQNVIQLNSSEFAKMPNISLDYAVMEKTERAVILPADLGWTDVGSWQSMWNLAEKDTDNNAVFGGHSLHESSNCYIHNEDDSFRITAVGVDNLLVVAHKGQLLIADKSYAPTINSFLK